MLVWRNKKKKSQNYHQIIPSSRDLCPIVQRNVNEDIGQDIDQFFSIHKFVVQFYIFARKKNVRNFCTAKSSSHFSAKMAALFFFFSYNDVTFEQLGCDRG